MKVILTGATGLAGAEVLARCIAHPSITSIIVLSRRPLPNPPNPKVHTVIATDDDYLTYDKPAIRQATAGADACIWSLGDPWADVATARTISFDYPLAAARVFSQRHKETQTQTGGDGKGEKFRFVYLSGGAVERDQSKPLWFLQDERKIRGQAEVALLAYAKEHADALDAYILKPGIFLRKEFKVVDLVTRLAPSVRVVLLAKVLVETALNGAKEDTLLNGAIVAQGKKL
ncbi:putative nucleoside-diphosphate-sugar epimerase [Podospora appendiculata]|uniref:Nucleoside-diphosphate-sugar epimerase n=1 Tax=Podospora appendiculata TaxID=314037 RepID=A0AAE0X835_9PEZI|nr:putative nucleoside-diphosphate-sugar epimerase [Podospora appendiculata]